MTFQSQTFEAGNVTFVYEPMPPAIIARTPRQVADAIVRDVAGKYDLTVSDLKGRVRDRPIAWPRQEAYSAVRSRLGWSYPRIGRYFGDRDHSTIIHGIGAYEARMERAA